MPKAKSNPSSSSKKKQKLAKTKKHKKSNVNVNQPQEALSNVCNIAGFGDVGGLMGNSDDLGLDAFGGGMNEMDCLEELATAQVGPTASDPMENNNATDASSGNKEGKHSNSKPSSAPPPPPPGIHQMPNIRIELARHLHTQTISTFLLQSCPGLRMPTFERWVLDSKLEETDRFQSIIEEWVDDPSSKLVHTSGKAKKKYGRAAVYEKKDADPQYERETARKDKDCKLLLGAEKRIPSQGTRKHDASGHAGSWIRHMDRDPVLPYQAIETDESCDRLLTEIIAAMAANSDEELGQEKRHAERAREIVQELCHRSTEACKELQMLEYRLGKYQKFAWDSASADIGSKKKRKRGGGNSGGGHVDKILVEWHGEDEPDELQHKHQLCSLIYVPKKRKSSRSSSTAGATGADQDDDTSNSQHKPKPFVIKINASHYHKLRTMFDATYNLTGPSSSTQSMTKEQATHAFHAILFSTVIRYSSLSGGQQLNDWRGGGMQGAVHDGVFDCLSKWFGGSASGTECFASPFNSTLDRFFSAFPSPDVDGHFGSHGDFFHPSPTYDFLRSGWYELNPPFSPGVMSKMVHRIGALLDASCKQKLDVTFIIVIPTVRSATDESPHDTTKVKVKKKRSKHSADDEESKEKPSSANLVSAVHHAASQSFHQLVNSAHCKSHIILPAREHGYIEGGQHLRPTKFKESQYSTSVIVFRSNSWIDGDDAELFEKEVRGAFASRHAMEIEQRREIINA